MHTALEKRVLGKRGSRSRTSERTLPTSTAASWNWECVEGEDLLHSFHSETEPLGQDSLKTVVLGPALHILRPTVKIPLAQTGKETNEKYCWKSLPKDHHLLLTRGQMQIYQGQVNPAGLGPNAKHNPWWEKPNNTVEPCLNWEERHMLFSVGTEQTSDQELLDLHFWPEMGSSKEQQKVSKSMAKTVGFF